MPRAGCGVCPARLRFGRRGSLLTSEGTRGAEGCAGGMPDATARACAAPHAALREDVGPGDMGLCEPGWRARSSHWPVCGPRARARGVIRRRPSWPRSWGLRRMQTPPGPSLPRAPGARTCFSATPSWGERAAHFRGEASWVLAPQPASQASSGGVSVGLAAHRPGFRWADVKARCRVRAACAAAVALGPCDSLAGAWGPGRRGRRGPAVASACFLGSPGDLGRAPRFCGPGGCSPSARGRGTRAGRPVAPDTAGPCCGAEE